MAQRNKANEKSVSGEPSLKRRKTTTIASSSNATLKNATILSPKHFAEQRHDQLNTLKKLPFSNLLVYYKSQK